MPTPDQPEFWSHVADLLREGADDIEAWRSNDGMDNPTNEQVQDMRRHADEIECWPDKMDKGRLKLMAHAEHVAGCPKADDSDASCYDTNHLAESEVARLILSTIPVEQTGAELASNTAGHTQQEGTQKMPTNTQNMTAKKAIAILKGELDRLRSEFASTKLMEQRLARASGENAEGIAEVGRNVDKALNRVEEAYEYALNALAVARKRNKNAPKEAKALGVFVGVQLTGTTALTALETNDDDDEGAEYEEEDGF